MSKPIQTNIRAVWDQVRPTLADFASWPCVDWRPEDIYAECVNGESALFMTPEGAFAVLRPFKNQYTLTQELEVRVCYVPHPHGRDEHMQFLIDEARAIGATRLVFHSPRTGFERDPRWTKLDSRYVHEIGD